MPERPILRPSAWSARPLVPPRTRPSSAKSTNWSAPNAQATAEEGAVLAREMGFDASPLVSRSDRNVWRVILDVGAG
jgi:hypothetical protein